MLSAQSDATHSRLHRHNMPPHTQRALGRTGLHASRLGFGCYRIDAVTLAHEEALREALARGINLIDTSTNYGDGESEQLVGNVLRALLAEAKIAREDVVLVSKAGYVQGQNLRLAMEREYEGAPFPEMVKYMEGCWHCIHPDFLEDQLERSLARLQVAALDVLLLHNPEYFLSHALKYGTPLSEARAEYYRRIAHAFEFLERKVAEGKIGWYGISSNTFPKPSIDPEFTALEEVWQIAESIPAQHHFAVIQFPMNLFESGAAFEKNQCHDTQPVLDFAREHGLATLANRPLNAVTGEGMMRLADFDAMSPAHAEEIFHQQLAALSTLEKEFVEVLAPRLELHLRLQNLDKIFRWAEQLEGALHFFRGWAHWDHVKQHTITPHVERALHFLRNLVGTAPVWSDWESRYRASLQDVLQTLSAVHGRDAAEHARALNARIEGDVPELRTTPSLSQKALRVLLNTNGLDVALLGMRRMEYVDDGLQALHAPPLANITKAYRTWKN